MILLQQSSSSALWDELERVLTRLRAHARQQVERTEFEASGLGGVSDGLGRSGFSQRPEQETSPERWNPAAQLQDLVRAEQLRSGYGAAVRRVSRWTGGLKWPARS